MAVCCCLPRTRAPLEKDVTEQRQNGSMSLLQFTLDADHVSDAIRLTIVTRRRRRAMATNEIGPRDGGWVGAVLQQSEAEAVAGAGRIVLLCRVDDVELVLLRLLVDLRRQARVLLLSAEIAFNYIKCLLINVAVLVVLQELDLVQACSRKCVNNVAYDNPQFALHCYLANTATRTHTVASKIVQNCQQASQIDSTYKTDQ